MIPCLFQQLLHFLQRRIFVVIWLELWCVHQGRVYLKTVGLDLILYLHESHQYPLLMGFVSFLLTCEIVPESWTMIIMVVNYLPKVPKEGFMMHPETWVDLRALKCIGTLFSNHASTWFWGALGAWWEAVQKLMWYWEAWAQGRKGLMGA